MNMDTKFIKPAQMFLCVILFLSLFVPWQFIRTIDEDNVTTAAITASATSGWAADNSYQFDTYIGNGPTLRHRDSNGWWTSESATVSYVAGSYRYVVSSSTNDDGDDCWELFVPYQKKAKDLLVEDGCTDIWLNMTVSSVSDRVYGYAKLYVRGEYDSDRDQEGCILMDRADFTMTTSGVCRLHFDLTEDPSAYLAALALIQEWPKDVQIATYFYFYEGDNPDASTTLDWCMETEDVDDEESLPIKLAGLLGGVGVFYFVVAFAMTAEFNPLSGVVKSIKRNSAYFLVLLVVVMLLVGMPTATAISQDDARHEDDPSEEYYDWSVWIALIALGLVGALCGFSMVKGSLDWKNIAACFIGAAVFIITGFWTGFNALLSIVVHPKFNAITLGSYIFIGGFFAIVAVAVYNYAQGKDEVWVE